MNPSSSQVAGQARDASAGVLAPLLGAAFLGLVVIFGVGFSTISVAHNAAHDVRHATNFPCH
jgi:cobalt transporter subunit CbtB